MAQSSIPAVYVRGGTSRALLFHARDLPGSMQTRPGWDAMFTAVLGSPDPGERQLDGMGGGISSLSKVAIIGPSTRSDADIDYLFAQVSVRGSTVSYRGNCGNISAAVGPFAVDEGLVGADDGEAAVRIHNVNTGKIIRARFAVKDGKAVVVGDLKIQGVAGSGAEIRLDFVEPGGATTGKLLPTGRATDRLTVAGVGAIEVSLVDAANPVVFVRADAMGLRGGETPAEIAADKALMQQLDALRVEASVAMGVAADATEAADVSPNLPLVAMVSMPDEEDATLRVRMISAGQPHKATPLTGAMCLAVAAHLPGTVVAGLAGPTDNGPIRIAHASGVLPVNADVVDGHARLVTVFRTQRRLMEGSVYLPG